MLARLQSDLTAAADQLASAAQLAERAGAARTRAEALTELGLTSMSIGELDAAEAHLGEAWTLWTREQDTWGKLLALHARARLALLRSDPKRARALRAEAVELAVIAGDPEWEARARVGLGDVMRQQRDFQGAREHFERALSLYRSLENAVHLALGLRKFAHALMHLGDFAAARAALAESLALFSRVEQRGGMAACAVGFACMLSAERQDVAAVRLLAASGLLTGDDTGVLQPADVRDRDDAIERSRSRLGAEAFESAIAQGRVTPLEELLAAAAASSRDPSTPRSPPAAGLHASLTARELDVLRLLPHGLSYAEIGNTLRISARTVDAHLRAIYAKLNVRSRHEAAGYALRHGIARLGDP
jgi:DNA-binding CsgD family transcriptional regulator/Tfp pilus assembly protein PilF